MATDYQLCLGTGQLTYPQLRELHEQIVAARGYGLRCVGVEGATQEYWAVAPGDASQRNFRRELFRRLEAAGLLDDLPIVAGEEIPQC